MTAEETRELLTMAAKAAGLSVTLWDGHTGVMCAIDSVKHGRMWMPLADDGDALRAAADKLEVIRRVEQRGGPCVSAGYVLPDTPNCINYVTQPIGDDACEAWRLAIVRALAAIGRAMP